MHQCEAIGQFPSGRFELELNQRGIGNVDRSHAAARRG
ncbi:Uncharacterised protein [Mycobacterium tuberculosis]|uniref:Uncharacterized protein n=1 Tax=Mycobacterium tuberculosis TaxID=1773 RepID=A0A916PAC7_MYCTX|nr:Protein of unknown function [Mycobacterium canettii CIPT 140070010]CCK65311.1 Protein of unknown function [Mycobacterium canettii CIPT 140070017]CPB96577.1 Uncharacterised protein [Mycobacterium tuberculosis]SIP63861.1 conserved hypothetical protein [Mycobacterium tuberculosis]